MSTRSLGVLTLDIVAKIGGFQKGMDQAARLTETRMREISASAKRYGITLGAALAAASVAIAAGVKHAIDQADQLNDLNQRLGLSAEALSGFAYAARQTGTDIEGLGVGLKKLSANMADALNPKSAQGKLFASLDIDPIDKATGRLKELEVILPEIADRFKNLHDDTLEAALAQDLFGKSGTDLLEFLNLGSDGIEGMRSKLRSLGGEMSQGTLSAADEFNDKLDEINTAIDGIFQSIAAQLLPEMNDLTEEFRKFAQEAKAGEGAAGAIVGLFERIGKGARLSAIEIRMFRENFEKGGVFGSYTGFIPALIKAREEFERTEKMRDDLLSTQAALGNPGNPGGRGVASARQAGRVDLAVRTGEEALRNHYGGADSATAAADKHSDALKQQEEAARQLQDALTSLDGVLEAQAREMGGPALDAAYEYRDAMGEIQRSEDTLRKLGKLDADAQAQLATARDQATEAYHRQLDAIEKVKSPLQRLLDQQEREIKLLGLTGAALQTASDLYGQSAEDIAKYGDQIAANNELIDQTQQAIENMDELRHGFEDFIDDAEHGKASFKDFVDTVVDQIDRLVAKWISAQIFGEPGTPGGGLLGGLFGGIFGGIFGTSPTSSGSSSSSDLFDYGLGLVGSFAGGTDNHPGGWSIVGEEGPELMNVPRGAQILPAGETRRALAGGGGATTIINNYSLPTDPRTRDQVASDLQRVLRRNGARA